MMVFDIEKEMKALRDSWVKLAKERLQQGKSFPITFVILCTRDPQTHERWNEPGAILYMPREDDDDGKDEASIVVKSIAISGDAIAVLHMSDAWAVTLSREEMKEDRLRASEHPRRRECITTFIEFRHMDKTISQRHFYRSGKKVVWEEVQEDETPLKDHGGRLVALPRADMVITPHMEEMAQRICRGALMEVESAE